MDDDRDYSDDLRDDYLLDQYGPLYVEDRIDQIVLDWHTSGVDEATWQAHAVTYPLAQAEVVKAKARLDAGEWDEAVFHVGRALDGYMSAVFIEPIRELLVAPFRMAFPHADVDPDTLLGKMTGVESGYKFARVIIAATRSEQETRQLKNALRHFINSKVPGNWCTRNNTAHRLANLTEDESKTFIANAEALLNRLADPLEGATEAAAAAERETQEQRASRKSIGHF